MIRLSEIGRASGPDFLEFDHLGLPTEWGLGGDVPATVFVDEVTDAVRTFRDGALDASLDRNQMWAVCGFRLTREVVSRLPTDEFTAEDLLRAVQDAGFDWTRIRIAAS